MDKTIVMYKEHGKYNYYYKSVQHLLLIQVAQQQKTFFVFMFCFGIVCDWRILDLFYICLQFEMIYKI